MVRQINMKRLLFMCADIIVPPRNVNVMDVTRTSITVTFDPIPCLDQSADIMDYAIDFGRSRGPPFTIGRTIDGFSFTLDGLNKSTSYFFEIYPVIQPSLGLSVQRTEHIDVQTLSGK